MESEGEEEEEEEGVVEKFELDVSTICWRGARGGGEGGGGGARGSGSSGRISNKGGKIKSHTKHLFHLPPRVRSNNNTMQQQSRLGSLRPRNCRKTLTGNPFIFEEAQEDSDDKFV